MNEVKTSGPLFDDQAEKAAKDYCLRVEESLGEKAVRMIHERLHQVLQNPTGYYESQVQVERHPSGTVVTDGGVIYGPWLEGVGSRNKTTRFKGYATFRKVGQALEAAAKPIAEAELPRYVKKMN